MSGYLDVARRIRAARDSSEKGSVSRPESEAATDARTTRQSGAVRLTSDGRRLKAAGFEPKMRGGKVIWQRPDTGFWFSQEIALHLLERGSTKEGHVT